MKTKNANPFFNVHLSLFIFLSIFHLSTFNSQLLPTAHAAGTSLKISPTLLRIEAKPPADVWTPFTIENRSNQPINLAVGYKSFDPNQSKDGAVVFLKDVQSSPGQTKKIFEKMQIVDKNNISHATIKLGPKQKEQLRLRINIPHNESDGDYYFSLVFLEIPIKGNQNIMETNIEQQRSISSLQTGIGLNVLLTIGDKKIPHGTIDTFSAPLLKDSGPIPFTLTVRNNSTHFITPQGTILIKNILGQTVDKIAIPPSVILAGTSRMISSNQHHLSDNQNQELQIVWPKRFLLGMYTADLSLALSDKGPIQTRSIHFFIFPFTILIGIVLSLIIAFLIYLKVKRLSR